MPATTGYQAGFETDDLALSYLAESVWATTPAAQFQRIRLIGEALSGAKNRTRPPELVPNEEVAQAITTQETAGGTINFGLSYGTYDDFIAGALGADWQAPQAINGVAGDITITNLSATSATLSSVTANKFLNLFVGQWIRLLGFSNAANNAFFRVSAKASNQSVTLTSLAATVTETPSGTNAKVRGSTITNGTIFKSFSIQKQMGPSVYFRYPGSVITGLTIGGEVGGFMTGQFNVLSQIETKATADWSTGAVLAAPTGSVNDTVPGFGGVYLNEVALSAGVSSFNLTLTRARAAAQYAMGNAAAAGMVRGALEVSGTLGMFFRSHAEYDLFKSEAAGRISAITRDQAGNAYVITLPTANLMNPQITAGETGTSVMARFTIEGNPAAAGGTVQFDRLPAT